MDAAEKLIQNHELSKKEYMELLKGWENPKVSRKLTEEYKQKRKTIPWNAMYGMRNRIVHDYGNVDLKVVYKTKKNDIIVGYEEVLVFRNVYCDFSLCGCSGGSDDNC